jgi:serine/threonine protein kinase
MASHALAVDTETVRKTTSSSLSPPETPTTNPADNEPIEFIYDLDLSRAPDDPSTHEFGRGVWSVVYKATTTWTQSSATAAAAAAAAHNSLFTPPHSPVPILPSRSRAVVAVKSPLARDAHPVLRAEAAILSLLSAKSSYNDTETNEYVVPFYGFLPATHALVLQAVPLPLSSHIEDCAALARRQFSTKTMFEPVLTAAHWRELAAQLIKGLEWVHGAGVVHGDIKPHNILLRHTTAGGGFGYDALYADFSSAHLSHSQHDEGEKEGEQGSAASQVALTPPYAAPELMTVAAMKAHSIPTTRASDIFALGLTLLAAATGDTLVYSHSGTSDMQRLAMSREGHRALDYVRSGPHASRVVRDGMVERVVAPAIARAPGERVLQIPSL